INFGFYLRDASGAQTNELAWSDIHNAVRDADGIRKVDPSSTGFTLNGMRQDVPLEPQQFPVLGAITLVDVDDGQAF
ncbi:MAG: t4-like baseplate wedge, partial [Polyangiaceae bacterium]|nr:t4-like baseplate wedge [Polyangiaceae bacterium]